MAERRMFAKTIVLSDSFLDMPLSARCLYFTLGMVADDDGFVNNPKSIMRQCGAQEDDMKILFAKKFLLAFESGVIVIKHWRINNYLQKDRYNETKYLDEKSMLSVEKNGTYHMNDGMYTQDMYTQVRLGKDSIGYNTSDKSEAPEKKSKKKPIYDHTSIPYRAAKWLSEQIMERLPEQKAYSEPDLQRWADDFRLMNTSDGYEWELIEKVLQYSQEDYFWSQNILSAAKFRKQFSTLLAKAKASGYV